MNITRLVKSVLAGEVDLSSLSKEELEEIQEVMGLMKAKWISPKQQKKNRAKNVSELNEAALSAADVHGLSSGNPSAEPKHIKSTDLPKEPKKKGPLTVIKEEMSFNKSGQWSLDKDDNTIDYSKFNKKPKQPETTIDYSGKEPEIKGKKWTSKDVTGVPRKKVPASPDKEARIQRAVKEGKVIDDRGESKPKKPETAMETFKRRGQNKV